MSYCRFGWDSSEVYVYADVSGGWTTHVAGAGSFNDPTAAACADRLESLRKEGVSVPQYAIDELRADHRTGRFTGTSNDAIP